MRGLEIRVEYAKAKLTAVSDADQAREQMLDAIINAEAQGREDFFQAFSDAPVMFQDEAELCRAWAKGWQSVDESLELESCSSCNDGSGNPCHIHG